MALTTEGKVSYEGTGADTQTRIRKRWSRYSNRTFYFFLFPWLFGFFGLTVFPMLYVLAFSFTNFDGISARWRWIGLQNYIELLHSPDTWFSLERTFLYTVIIVPSLVACGLGLALLVNRPWFGIGIFRAIFFIPSIIPIVASVVAWKIIFDRDAGAVNAAIEHLGGSAITWLVDPNAFFALIIMVIWGVGGGMIISLAGLQGIPQELQEAARVDGANSWQVFHSVIFPLLTPVLFFQVVTNIIYALQTLVQPFLLTISSGIAGAVDVPRGNFFYMVNVYTQFLYNERFGYGSALLWILFVFILLITLIIFRFGSFWVYYEVDQEGRG